MQELITKICKVCNQEFQITKEKHKRTCCSRKCANSIGGNSNKDKTKIVNCIDCNKQIEVKNRTALLKCRCKECYKQFKKSLINKFCKICGTKLNKNYHTYCSHKCVCLDPENIKNLSLKTKAAILDGRIKPWQSRTKLQPSYPEQYFINLFVNENITNYEREKKVGKYFIDFAFNEHKLALEIDGGQHNLPDRKKSDINKDEFLTKEGWSIFRIKWFNPINTTNKQKLYSQIDQFKKIWSGW